MKQKIKNALVSLSDKTELTPILKVLKKFKIKIISSGGTYSSIKKLGYDCLEVSEYTGFKEMLDGRVKTLHPKIHAGILHDRSNKKHKREMNKEKFPTIDLIIVNFYPFQNAVLNSKNQKKIIENIDIGGPAMVRAAAKNYNDITVITKPEQYKDLIRELNTNKSKTTLKFRQKMSEIAFTETAYYDGLISNYFNSLSKNLFPKKKIFFGNLIEEFYSHPRQMAHDPS